MASIHPLAVVHPQAEIAAGVSIGPYCTVDEGVVISEGCELAARVSIKRGAFLGPHNTVSEGAVLGGNPQHARIKGPTGKLLLGQGNTIRENVTMHVALVEGGYTVVGDNNLFMVGSHVAHDCRVGNHVIAVNHVLLGGHVHVDDYAYLGGGSAVHQFCRVGRNVMLGACSRVTQDVPPFVLVDGGTGKIVGLNRIGLRRNGYTTEQIDTLKAAYRVIYRSGYSFDEVLEHLAAEFPDAPACEFHAFLAGSQRGFINERRDHRKVEKAAEPSGATPAVREFRVVDSDDDARWAS